MPEMNLGELVLFALSMTDTNYLWKLAAKRTFDLSGHLLEEHNGGQCVYLRA